MIASSYQIDFITPSGSRRLLEFGMVVEKDPVISVKQGERVFSPLGADWGEYEALGGATVSLQWTAVRNHASHAAKASYVLRAAATHPSQETGTLRVAVENGETWDVENAVVSSSAPMALMPSGSFETVTAYAASGGRMVPAAVIEIYEGMAWDFILQDWDDVDAEWDDF